MAKKDTLAYGLKLFLLVYWLPSHAIAEAFPLILGAYISILSLVRDLAASDSQNDLSNETLFEQSGFVDQFEELTMNYTVTDNYTVSVSNAVLWVCRKGSYDADFYRQLYRMAIGCLITFHLITSFSRFFTEKFWHTVKDDGIRFITIVGSILLNLSFLFLLLSFDITPWSCISEPSSVSIEYISFSNRFDIQIEHSSSAITFQQVASILSAVLAFSWLTVRIVFFCRDVIKGQVDERIENCSCDEADVGPTDQLEDDELLEIDVENK